MNAIPSAAPALLTVHRGAIAENYRLFRSMTGADVAGVLKADAYGTGAEEVFKTLRAEGCGRFFVATPEEAFALRALDPSCEIMLLGGVYQGTEGEYADRQITPILNSYEEIERWAAFAGLKGNRLPAVIHVDTGMNRLGLGAEETARLIQDLGVLAPLDLKLIMTHFACSDEKDHPMNIQQAEWFGRIAEHFPATPKSLSNSSGLFRDKNWHYDLVRPGFALYGGNPTPEATNPVRRVVDLSVRILQIKAGKAGESAGYNATHVFPEDTSLAIVALGYADGFLRGGSNKAALFWNGQRCPVVGRVSMDLIIVDIGKVQDPAPQTGDLLEVLGPHQSVDDLAAACGTIGYEILTSLGRRYARVYV